MAARVKLLAVGISIVLLSFVNPYADVLSVSRIADLMSITTCESEDIVIVVGYSRPGDGGGGMFRWDATLSSGENGGTIFKPKKVESGRWVRMFDEYNPVNIRWFGAAGDGDQDDTEAIQRAINYARQEGKGLYFPQGNYRVENALDFTDWQAIAVSGDGPGNVGIAGAAAVTQITFCGVEEVGADFSGSSYGKISGIAFARNETRPKATVLLARTQTGYGSDLYFENCNFASGSVAAVYCHSAEVITFSGCRFHCGGRPGFLVTGMRDYGVTSPFTELCEGISLTQWTILGGEFTSDNAPCILLDGRQYSLGDFSAHGTYFAISGSNASAFKILGPCANITFIGHRCEVTHAGTNYGFGWIDGSVNGLFLKAKVTSGPILFGNGSMTGAFVSSESNVELAGNVTNSEIVSYQPMESNQGKLNPTVVGGDISGSRFFLHPDVQGSTSPTQRINGNE